MLRYDRNNKFIILFARKSITLNLCSGERRPARDRVARGAQTVSLFMALSSGERSLVGAPLATPRPAVPVVRHETGRHTRGQRLTPATSAGGSVTVDCR